MTHYEAIRKLKAGHSYTDVCKLLVHETEKLSESSGEFKYAYQSGAYQQIILGLLQEIQLRILADKE